MTTRLDIILQSVQSCSLPLILMPICYQNTKRYIIELLNYITSHTKFGIDYSDASHKLYEYIDSDHVGIVHKDGRRTT